MNKGDYIKQQLTKDEIRQSDKAKSFFLLGIILAVLVVILGVISISESLYLAGAAMLAGCLGGANPSLDKLLGSVGGLFFIWLGVGLYCGDIIGSFLLLTVYILIYSAFKCCKKSEQAKAEYENLSKNYQKKYHKSRHKSKYRNYNNYSH